MARLRVKIQGDGEIKLRKVIRINCDESHMWILAICVKAIDQYARASDFRYSANFINTKPTDLVQNTISTAHLPTHKHCP